MSLKWPKTGVNHAPAYQVSGIPFVTSSVASEVNGVDANGASPEPISVEFPNVTKFVTIRNTGINELRVGFSARGMFAPNERLPVSVSAAGTAKDLKSGRNYFLIPSASEASGGSHRNISDTVVTLDVRCTKIFFVSNASDNSPAGAAYSTDFSLIAGLTPIEAGQFPVLTGSINATGSFHGVG